jgi:hypothetical protein
MGRRTLRWSLIAAGAAWGFISYLVLWGYTPIVVTEQFVVSLPGLVLLLPARLVLESIHLVEQRVVHHPFDFSNTNGWIGYAAAAAGAAIAWLAGTLLAAVARLGRRRPGQPPDPGSGDEDVDVERGEVVSG